MLDDKLTSAEHRILQAANCGASVDFRDPTAPSVAAIASTSHWGAERSVRAHVLTDLVADASVTNASSQRAVRVAGARILGSLDLEGLSLSRPLVLDGCFFEEAMNLDEAIAPRLEFTHCWIPALSARNLETHGDLILDGLIGTREVTLAGARIGGLLALRGARIDNPEGVALDGAWLTVRTEFDARHLEAIGEVKLIGADVGGMLRLGGARLRCEATPALRADGLAAQYLSLCPIDSRRCEVDGEVRLIGAHIGWIDFQGARLSNTSGPALAAGAMQIDHSMHCDVADGYRFEVSGGVSLVGTHVGGSVDLDGAMLSNEGGCALIADGLTVTEDMFCRADEAFAFEAKGEFRLLGAEIRGELSFGGAKLASSWGLALDLEATSTRELRLPDSDPPAGIVDLTNAYTGRLYDSWRPAENGDAGHHYAVRIRGLVYESLGAGSDASNTRLHWLAHAEDGYRPQGYDQLSAVFRRAGRDEDARRVDVAKHRRRRRDLPVPARTASYFVDGLVGYGYKTWRAGAIALLIIMIGGVVFNAAFPQHMVATRSAGLLPHFNSWLYSLNAVLPGVNLGQTSAWAPTGIAQIWYAFSVVAGWLLALGVVAYVTAKLFRE